MSRQGHDKRQLIIKHSFNMPRLTRDERQRALGMLHCGMSYRQVARHFGCTHRTVSLLHDRNITQNSADDRPRSGRPRVTTARQDRNIVLSHLRDPFLTATHTAAETHGRDNPRISSDTVRRRLRAHQMRARRPYRGPILTNIHRNNRLTWCQQHQRWRIAQWNEVAFSDESRFCLDVSDGRHRVWRRNRRRYADCCVHETNRWGGPNVLVWAAISGRYRTPLCVVDGNLTAQRYVDEILRPHLVPFMRNNPGLRRFQQDNARPHIARHTTTFLQQEIINTIQWPSLSPDLNPLEHLWDFLGRQIVGRSRTREELIDNLRNEWERIPQAFIQRLVASMHRRCTACIQARGGHTRY